MKIFLNYIISSFAPVITFLLIYLTTVKNENGQGNVLIIIASFYILIRLLILNGVLFLNLIPSKNIFIKKVLIIFTNLLTPIVMTFIVGIKSNYNNLNHNESEFIVVFISLFISYVISLIFILKMIKSLNKSMNVLKD